MDEDRILDRAVALALDAADAEAATRRALEGLDLGDSVRVLAAGKAAIGMARAACARCRGAPALVVAPDGPDARGLPAVVLRAGHPLADERSARAAEAALAFVAEPAATLLVLLSGGGSALLEKALPGVSLEELRRVSDQLSREGAGVERWNAIRGALSAVKHGRLLAAAGAARVVNVVVSDVPGAPPEVVASGPTSPPPPLASDETTWRELERLLGRSHPRPATVRVPAGPMIVAASAESVRDAVARALVGEGLLDAVHVVREAVHGEASEAALELHAALVASGAPALVAGGEVTVSVRGNGVGGPASELMLSLLLATDANGLALGTDGIDGTSQLAGARVTPRVRGQAQALGLDARSALENNDAATFFTRAGGAIVTGPTGTNTAELYVLLRGA